jgi:hypothetical protein
MNDILIKAIQINLGPVPPCIVCDRTFDSSTDAIDCGDRGVDAEGNEGNWLMPSGGTLFYTYGHYGSTFWDSITGADELQLVVCDACLKAKVNSLRVTSKLRLDDDSVVTTDTSKKYLSRHGYTNP